MNYSWAVSRMELFTLYHFHRLWKGLWYCRSQHTLANSSPLWNPGEVYCRHKTVVLQFSNHGNTQSWTYTAFLCEDRSPTRLHPITYAFSFGYWLDNEDHNGRFQDGIQWTLLSQLHDLDFADNLALLSHNHRQTQDKVYSLATTTEMAGLNIKKNRKNTTPRPRQSA